MITAVDTNVLIDILTDDPVFREDSLAALRRCLARGTLVACDIVWAEVVAAFPDVGTAQTALRGIPVAYQEVGVVAATRAGVAWRAYRQAKGTRERLVTDFLVGAHALEQADRLLTRDRGFHRAAFEGLTIIDPAPTPRLGDPS